MNRKYCISASNHQTYNTLFCETSAKEGSNILEAVLHLARWDAAYFLSGFCLCFN